MTTTTERRAQLRLKAISQADKYARDIMIPVLTASLESDSRFTLTKREIDDKFGVVGVRCFVLMFKLLQRGGRTRDGVPFKSSWVVNQAALPVIRDWSLKHDSTLKELEAQLKAITTELVWVKGSKLWTPKSDVDAMKKPKRQTRSIWRKYIESPSPRTAEERIHQESLQ